jgi:hypothetical protein
MQTDLPRPDAQLKPAVVVKTFIEEPLQMCEAKVEYHCRNLLDARIPCRVELFSGDSLRQSQQETQTANRPRRETASSPFPSGPLRSASDFEKRG